MSTPIDSPDPAPVVTTALTPPGFERQVGMLPPAAYNTIANSELLIIGVGAIGALLADRLHRIAHWNAVHLVDPDRVDNSNLVTQFWSMNDLDQPKVSVMQAKLQGIKNNVPVHAHMDLWDLDNVGFRDFTFVCVDTILARRTIFERYMLAPKKPRFYCDIRIGGPMGQVYTIADENELAIGYYETTLFPPAQATGGTCSQSSFNGVSTVMVGHSIVSPFRDYFSGSPVLPVEWYCQGRIFEPEEYKEFAQAFIAAKRQSAANASEVVPTRSSV